MRISYFFAVVLLSFVLLCNASTIPESELHSFDKRACKPLNTQCNGVNYKGPKCCQSGKCKRLNDWYWYCSK